MTFVKGQSGNPKGRAPGTQLFAPVLRAELDAVRAGTSNRERLARVVVARALKGDLEALKWIVDRVDGKVAERVEADVSVGPALDAATRYAVLEFAARRRALERGA